MSSSVLPRPAAADDAAAVLDAAVPPPSPFQGVGLEPFLSTRGHQWLLSGKLETFRLPPPSTPRLVRPMDVSRANVRCWLHYFRTYGLRTSVPISYPYGFGLDDADRPARAYSDGGKPSVSAYSNRCHHQCRVRRRRCSHLNNSTSMVVHAGSPAHFVAQNTQSSSFKRTRGRTATYVLPEPRLLARAVGYRWPSRTSSGRALRPLDWPVGSMPVQARQACRSLARSFRQAS